MLKGKAIWINVIKECDGGDIQKIANKCAQAGISYALIKVIEGKSGFNYSGDIDLVPVLTTALREKGIDVVAWGAVYGDAFGAGNWKQEVNRIVRRMNDELKDINMFVLDIESRWRDQHSIADRFMNELLAGLRLDCALGFSSFRYPEQHPTIPYDSFLSSVHVNMPQVYWEGAQDPIDQLRECISQYIDLGYGPYNIPMVPAGPAYHLRDKNWETTPKAMRQFFAEVIAQGFESCTFWDYKHARSTGLWPVIESLEFPVDPELPDPPVDPHTHPRIKENADAIEVNRTAIEVLVETGKDHALCTKSLVDDIKRMQGELNEWRPLVEGCLKANEKCIKDLMATTKIMKGELDAGAQKIMDLEINQNMLAERVRILEWKLSFWKWLGRLLRIAPEDAE